MDTETLEEPLPSTPPRLYDARRCVEYDKPKLRGWLHLLAFEFALVLGTIVIVRAHGATETTVAAVYAAAVAGLFGVSALYHRGQWGARASAWLQRLDHVMIVLLIAGSATPPMALCLPDVLRPVGLIALWALAGAAIGMRLAWMHAPERLVGSIYVGLGVASGAAIPAVWMHSGPVPALLLLAGGVLYVIGAIGYHRRSPDPQPSVFGYHEVFHTYVTVAAACHYVAVGCFLL